MSRSRYEILEGLNDTGMENQPDTGGHIVPNQNPPKTLPTIHTNQQYQRTNAQPEMVSRLPQNTRGAHRGRGGGPRQATAELEHTVVRGSNKGKQITSEVVYHMNDPFE